MRDFGKYSFWNWLLFSQVYEVFSAVNKLHRAEELADIISVCMEYIEAIGFNPMEIHNARTNAKEGEIKEIFLKYSRAYSRIQKETKKWPKEARRR